MICEFCGIRCKDNAYRPYCGYICFNVTINLEYLESINDKILHQKVYTVQIPTLDEVKLTEPHEMFDFLQRMEDRFNLKPRHFRQVKTATVVDLTKIFIKDSPSGKQVLAINRARKSDEYYRKRGN